MTEQDKIMKRLTDEEVYLDSYFHHYSTFLDRTICQLDSTPPEPPPIEAENVIFSPSTLFLDRHLLFPPHFRKAFTDLTGYSPTTTIILTEVSHHPNTLYLDRLTFRFTLKRQPGVLTTVKLSNPERLFRRARIYREELSSIPRDTPFATTLPEKGSTISQKSKLSIDQIISDLFLALKPDNQSTQDD